MPIMTCEAKLDQQYPYYDPDLNLAEYETTQGAARAWWWRPFRPDGKRHQAARSRYYCDEDTWACNASDQNGQDGIIGFSLRWSPLDHGDNMNMRRRFTPTPQRPLQRDPS